MHKAERHALLTSLLVPITAVAVVVDAAWPLVPILFVLSPLAVLWLVWVVLNDTAALPPDLHENQEWDYLDRPDLMQRKMKDERAPDRAMKRNNERTHRSYSVDS